MQKNVNDICPYGGPDAAIYPNADSMRRQANLGN